MLRFSFSKPAHVVPAPRWRIVAVVAAAQLALCGAALASSPSGAIVVGRGIDGVQLRQTKAQVESRLGVFPCDCDRIVWSYVGFAGAQSPVSGVEFTESGVVNEVFAIGSRTENHLTTARGVGLGSTLSSVERAYKSAGCSLVPGAKATGGPPSGRCAIVTRLGVYDADTVFIASDGDHSLPGSVYDVAVGLLSSAGAATISVSVSPKPVAKHTSSSSATVAVVVQSLPFYEFPNGLGIAGDPVRLTSTSRALRFSRVSDHGNGAYTATITRSRRSTGVVRLTASDGAVSQSVKLSLATL
ncbi:MAG: hypothetical protein ACLP01_27705 [Solirubrobacteraceae bacterium]